MSSVEALMELPYTEIEVDYDPILRLLWIWMTFESRPTYTWRLLDDLATIQNGYRALAKVDPKIHDQIRFTCYGSRFPGVFCYGGDLAVFSKSIAEGRLDVMVRYARSCIDATWRSSSQFRDTGIVTTTLVQGDALGGGFESALAGQLIVAERGVKFGLPEIAFNLYPGMGAVSFLARRLGVVEAEKMILSGRIMLAEELYERGVVQRLADVGDGERVVQDYIRELNEDRGALAAALSNDPVSDVTYSELIEIVMLWAEASLRLSATDLRKMEKLVSAQFRRIAREPAPALALEVGAPA